MEGGRLSTPHGTVKTCTSNIEEQRLFWKDWLEQTGGSPYVVPSPSGPLSVEETAEWRSLSIHGELSAREREQVHPDAASQELPPDSVQTLNAFTDPEDSCSSEMDLTQERIRWMRWKREQEVGRKESPHRLGTAAWSARWSARGDARNIFSEHRGCSWESDHVEMKKICDSFCGAMRSIHLNGDNSNFACTGENGRVGLFNSERGVRLRDVKASRGCCAAIGGANNLMIVCEPSGVVSMYDTRQQACCRQLEVEISVSVPGGFCCVDWHGDTAIWSVGGSLCVIRASERALSVVDLWPSAFPRQCSGVCLWDGGRSIISSCYDGLLRLSNTSSSFVKFDVPCSAHRLLCCTGSSSEATDQTFIAAAGDDRSIVVHQPSGERMLQLLGHVGPVTGLSFVDNSTLVSVSHDRRIIWWNIDPEGATAPIRTTRCSGRALCVAHGASSQAFVGTSEGHVLVAPRLEGVT